MIHSPDLYIAAIDNPNRRAAAFRMTRDTYRDSVFLDERTVSIDGRQYQVPLDELLAQYRSGAIAVGRMRYIFHTACCGSTFLCRCLDDPGVCLPYKEPYLLHQLAQMSRHQPGSPAAMADPGFTDLALALLSRTYQGGEVPVLKPTDSCANLAPDLLRRSEAASAVMLYQPLDEFMVTMLKQDDRRSYMRTMLERARLDLDRAGVPTAVLSGELDDVQVISSVWVALMQDYLQVLEDEDCDARSLSAKTLFERPVETTLAVYRYFGIEADEGRCRARLEDGVLSRNSKDQGATFSAQERQEQEKSLLRKYENDIHRGTEWAEAMMGGKEIPVELPRPLKVQTCSDCGE